MSPPADHEPERGPAGAEAVVAGAAEADWPTVLEQFTRHLADERGRSPATVRAYRTDLASLAEHARRMRREPAGLDLAVLRSWLAAQRSRGASAATIGRRASAARTFTGWAARRGVLTSDVGARLETPRRARTLPRVLQADQAAAVLAPPERAARRTDGSPPAGSSRFAHLAAPDGGGSAPHELPAEVAVALRDRLVVELLYSCALRVSELCGLDVDDVDAERRLLRVVGNGDRERRVPYGFPAAAALAGWLREARPELADRKSVV